MTSETVEGLDGLPEPRMATSWTGFERFCMTVTGMMNVLCFFVLPFQMTTVEQGTAAIILRYGKGKNGGSTIPPGLVRLGWMDRIERVDLRLRTYDIPSQQLLTGDTVTISVDAVMYWRVVDPWAVLTEVQDYYNATCRIGSVVVRSILSSKTLKEILSDRENLAAQICSQADDYTASWGVEVTNLVINNIVLPHNLVGILSVEAEAERSAKAMTVEAKGELKAAQATADAAARLSKGKGTALQLKYLNSLRDICLEGGENVLMYPIPLPGAAVLGARSAGIGADSGALKHAMKLVRSDLTGGGAQRKVKESHQ